MKQKTTPNSNITKLITYLPIIILLFSSFLSYSQSSELEWGKTFGGSSGDQAHSIVIDASGNSYITGYFANNTDFDPGPGTYNLSPVGSTDIFVLKLDANGLFVWARSIGGSSSDYAEGITIDNLGNVTIVGDFQQTCDFDPGAGTFNLTSNGLQDIFIFQLDNNGNFNWAVSMGGTSYDNGNAIACDNNNNIYTTGNFRNTVDFDPGSGVLNLTASSALYRDIYIQKLDQNGNFIWAKKIGGSQDDFAYDIYIHSPDTVFITGQYKDIVDFDPGAGTANLNSSSSFDSDLFILKLDGSGNYKWAQSYGANNVEVGYGITTDSYGNPYVTGATGNDIYISKRAANNGATIWNKTIGGTSSNLGRAIDTDPDGNVYFTGGFSGTTDFDPGTGVDSHISSGSPFDVFIEKLDLNGNFVWVKVMGTGNEDVGRAIVLDDSQSIYTAGYFFGTMDIDPGTATLNVNTNGGYDCFVQKFLQCNPIITNQTLSICDGTSLTVGTNTYTTTGNYTDVIPAYNGCDSIVNTDLTVEPAIVGSQTLSICYGDSITVGTNTYSTTGVYIDILTAANGCDSTVTTDLTVDPIIESTQILEICNGETVTVGTSTYNTTGIYSDVFSASNGCDSTVTTDLTVRPVLESTQTIAICSGDSIVVGTSTYTSTGVYIDVFITSMGCDSTVTTDLTVNLPTNSSQNITICDGDSILVGTNTYTSTGVYIDVLTGNNGCDSTITTDLTVNSPVINSQSLTICQGDSVIVGSNIYYTSGVYTDILLAANGCDSIVNTDLTVQTVLISVTQLGNVLTADENGATYQWLECPSMLAINGETNQTYTPIANGDYAVIININGCTDTSACYTVTGVGITENNFNYKLLIYPNPTTGKIRVEAEEIESIEVYNLQGQLLIGQKSEVGSSRYELDISTQPKGIYIIKVQTDKGIFLDKIIIE